MTWSSSWLGHLDALMAIARLGPAAWRAPPPQRAFGASRIGTPGSVPPADHYGLERAGVADAVRLSELVRCSPGPVPEARRGLLLLPATVGVPSYARSPVPPSGARHRRSGGHPAIGGHTLLRCRWCFRRSGIEWMPCSTDHARPEEQDALQDEFCPISPPLGTAPGDLVPRPREEGFPQGRHRLNRVATVV